MADKPTKTPGSITQPTDESGMRISDISNINKTISNMQKQIDQQLTELNVKTGDTEAIQEVQGSMVKVLQKLNSTVGQIGSGFTKVAADTAKIPGEAVKQYSQAIQQDINYNKQNIVAMALTRSSPIFGYYVSKFMETDVWKNSAAKMKANIGSALGSVGAKFKSALTGIATTKKKATSQDTGNTAESAKKAKVPHMQKGGVVEKGGLAKLHAAEIVMPVEKLLGRMDKQISTTRKMAEVFKLGQVRSIAKMSTELGGIKKDQQKSMFRAFVDALGWQQEEHALPFEQQVLRILYAIRKVLGAQPNSFGIIMTKMINENPTIRNLMLSLNLMGKVFGVPFKPIYAFFKSRGGYQAHLSKSPSPFQAMSENIGVLYTGSMTRLDRITLYTRGTAEAVRDLAAYITGKKYKSLPEIKSGIWSFFGGARGLVNWMTKWSVKGAGWGAGIGKSKEQKLAIRKEADSLADKLTKSRDPFWKKWFSGTFGGQQEMFESGLGATNIGSLIEVFSNQKLLKGVEAEGAIPVTNIGMDKLIDLKETATNYEKNKEKRDNRANVNTEKLLDMSQKSFKLENAEAKKSKKLIQITDQNWRENKQLNKRDKRKSIFSLFSGGFGAIKGILGSVMGFVPMIAGLFGLGKLGGGGLPGMITSLLTSAFLGKGRKSAKGGIIGSLARRFGKFIKGIKIKFPKGFLRKIGPALLSMGTRLGTLAGSIATRIGELFAAGGPILSAMGPVLGVAAAGVIGWKVGKQLDNILGISEKFQGKMAEWDKRANKLAEQVGLTTAENVKKARAGGEEGYEAQRVVGATAGLGKEAKLRQESVGFWGRRNLVAINSAQMEFMQKNIAEYLPYSPDVIASMRHKWLTTPGLIGGKGMGYDAASYGKIREEQFLKYLKANAKPMSEAQAKAHYMEYQSYFKKESIIDKAAEATKEAYGVAKEKTTEIYDKAMKEAGKMYGTAKEKTGGVFVKVQDIGKNQVKELAITGEALKTELGGALEKYSQKIGEAKDQLVGATNNQTVVISNSLQNTQNSVVNGAKNAAAFMQNTFANGTSHGEVDGD